MKNLLKNIIIKLLYILISIYLIIFIPSIWGEKPLVVISGSMEPTIHVYDVVLNKAVNSPEEIKVGDVITFISTSSISEGLTVTHRVQDIKIVNGEYEYVTKGDYNPTADSSTAKYGNVIGKVAFKIPQLGRVQFFVASKAGWFFVVLLPAMGVIVYDVLKLFKLLGTKNASDKIKGNNKKKNIDINVDKAIDNIKKNDYNSSSLDDLKKNVMMNKDIVTEINVDNINLNNENKKLELKEDINNQEVVNITKEDYLNRLNALKNRNKN